MKKALLFFAMLNGVVYAQDCSKLFISEYVEGWSNNKALEIYNPTNADINLAEYFVARYSDGATSVTNSKAVQLTGTVPAHGVYVAVLDKQDPLGTGQEAPIWDSLQVRADGFYSPDYNTSSAFYWNGNDVVLLAKGILTGGPTGNVTGATGFQIIDFFGKIGEDPLNGNGTNSPDGFWTTSFPYNNGIGTPISADHSLIRKPTVLKGVTANPSFFNALAEYDSIPPVTYLTDGNGDTIVGGGGDPILFGNWFSLGTHTCDCNNLATSVNQTEEITVFPNPTADGYVYVKGASQVKEVAVYNSLGQFVGKTTNTSNATLTIRLGIDRGVYILRLTENDGSVITKRVVVK